MFGTGRVGGVAGRPARLTLEERREEREWMENEVLAKYGSDMEEDDPALLLQKKVCSMWSWVYLALQSGSFV